MAYLLGIDVSTTGAKALLIDEGGSVAAEETTEYPLSTPRPLWSEQSPADWWRGVVSSIRAALAKAGIEGAAYGAALLAGVGTGTFSSVGEAVVQTVRITERVAPIPDHVRRYEALYPVYRSLYTSLAPAFRALSSAS